MITMPPNDKMVHSENITLKSKFKNNLKKHVKITPSRPGVEIGLAPPPPRVDSRLSFCEE